MRHIVAVVMILLLIIPGSAAAAPRGDQAGNGEDNPAAGDRQQVRAGENETSGVQQRAAENTTLREEENLPDGNRVRLAVHALLATENRTGGIGLNVSAVAREIDNSVRATTRAEEQIRARNDLLRFLFGGDEDAARLIREETQRNFERAAELRRSIGDCTCDGETRTMLQEQIRAIEQEQECLMTLANEEMQNRGLLGWL